MALGSDSGSGGLCVSVFSWHWLGASYCVPSSHPGRTGPLLTSCPLSLSSWPLCGSGPGLAAGTAFARLLQSPTCCDTAMV